MRARELERILLKDGWYEKNQKVLTASTDTQTSRGKLQYLFTTATSIKEPLIPS